jgi:hypothetical protein
MYLQCFPTTENKAYLIMSARGESNHYLTGKISLPLEVQMQPLSFFSFLRISLLASLASLAISLPISSCHSGNTHHSQVQDQSKQQND